MNNSFDKDINTCRIAYPSQRRFLCFSFFVKLRFPPTNPFERPWFIFWRPVKMRWNELWGGGALSSDVDFFLTFFVCAQQSPRDKNCEPTFPMKFYSLPQWNKKTKLTLPRSNDESQLSTKLLRLRARFFFSIVLTI